MGAELPGTTRPAETAARSPRHWCSPARSLFRLISERTIVSLITLCGISAIIFVFGIFFFIFREGAPFLRDCFDFRGFFLSQEWHPTSEVNRRYGILALLAGTGSVTVLAMAVAVPFGLGTAVFIAEFCGRRTRETLKILVEFLAAIPSVAWGFIGAVMLGPLITSLPLGAYTGRNVLNGGIVVGLMSVPIIVSIAEDAIRAVPDGYREAAEALGATRWQAVCRVILPAAKNGLLAAVLLGVGRAVGETMAVLMATGHAVNVPVDGQFPFFHALESVQTLTATIAAELGEAPRIEAGPAGYPPEARHYQALFVIGMVLFALTFAINLTADLIVRGVRRKA